VLHPTSALARPFDAAHVRAARDPRAPYPIPAGGTSALGNLAFVSAGLELGDQVAAGVLPEPHAVFVPLGTMGSAAGLYVGLRAAKLSTVLVAVRASSPGTSTRQRLERLVHETVAHLRAIEPTFPAIALDRERLVIDGSQLGAGYARPTEAGAQASALFRAHTTLELEATYSAKAAAAFVAEARRRPDRRLLFWHTHAAPRPRAVAAVEDLPAAFRGYLE
jgi:D-cysteine desulfhydrase